MPVVLRLLALAALLTGLTACAAPPAPPPGPEAAIPAAPGAAPRNAAAPGAAASGAAVTEPSLPPLALAPRSRWERIRLDPRSGLSAAWRASPAIPQAEGKQRRWIVGNLGEPIRLPETGGAARSVAFLADYHCEAHAWEPVEVLWFAERDARREVLRERPRGRGERRVAEGTLVDVFLDAACAPAAGTPRRR